MQPCLGKTRITPALVLTSALACTSPPGDSDVDSLRQLQEALPIRADANVIVVSFDSLRPDALGTYAYPRPTSQRIDDFARRSVVFERAFSVAPVTPTSFAATWTGMLPPRSFRKWTLVGGPTLAERLAAAGFYTAAIINNVQLAPERGFDRGFDAYSWTRNANDEKVLEQALDWLDDPPQLPFFFWLHLLRPHAPYRYHESAAHLYDPEYVGPFLRTTTIKFQAEDPIDQARIRSLYDGEVYRADAMFGRLLDGIQERGLLATSFVILTSDHGEEFGEHGGFQHGRLHQEHLRVPLIVHHPDRSAGSRTNVLYRNIDLLPTVLGWVGVPLSDHVDGIDLTRTNAPPEELVAVQMTTRKEDHSVSYQRGMAKLVVHCGSDPLVNLYDLHTDPGESANLSETRMDLVRQLAAGLVDRLGGPPCVNLARAVDGASPTDRLDDESRDALEALGYLGN